MLLDPRIPASTVGVSQDRISIEFQEHHCLYPDEPLTPGTDETECGDDILNAWLPQNIVVRHLEVCPFISVSAIEVELLTIYTYDFTREPSKYRTLSQVGMFVMKHSCPGGRYHTQRPLAISCKTHAYGSVTSKNMLGALLMRALCLPNKSRPYMTMTYGKTPSNIPQVGSRIY